LLTVSNGGGGASICGVGGLSTALANNTPTPLRRWCELGFQFFIRWRIGGVRWSGGRDGRWRIPLRAASLLLPQRRMRILSVSAPGDSSGEVAASFAPLQQWRGGRFFCSSSASLLGVLSGRRPWGRIPSSPATSMAPAGEGGWLSRLLRTGVGVGCGFWMGPVLEATVTASGAAVAGGGRRRARRRRPSGPVSGDGVEWWRRRPFWNKISRAPPRRW